ncbi:hypothetical protein Bca52824_011137 [Brassica carinata]|uniref:Uncharacterized protein n=1 Tax=Brassica carinata TaxID=52824 RepID=A0A8X7WCY3_BRACI|nr:hypothetical protein Bca52824_011137 [Brassica carinata]
MLAIYKVHRRFENHQESGDYYANTRGLSCTIESSGFDSVDLSPFPIVLGPQEIAIGERAFSWPIWSRRRAGLSPAELSDDSGASRQATTTQAQPRRRLEAEHEDGVRGGEKQTCDGGETRRACCNGEGGHELRSRHHGRSESTMEELEHDWLTTRAELGCGNEIHGGCGLEM